MTFQEDVLEILEKLNKASDEKLAYRGEITTNSKGEAQFKIRAFSNETAKVVSACKEIYDGFVQLCKDKQIKIAG